MLSERLNELRNAKRKGKWANSMQFASHVLLFIHQQADGLQNRDLLKFVIARTVFFRPTLTPHCVCCRAGVAAGASKPPGCLLWFF